MVIRFRGREIRYFGIDEVLKSNPQTGGSHYLHTACGLFLYWKHYLVVHQCAYLFTEHHTFEVAYDIHVEHIDG